MMYDSLCILGGIVIIVFLVFIGGHAIKDVISHESIDIKKKEAMSEADKFAAKLQQDYRLQQQRQQMSQQQLQAQQSMASPWIHGGKTPPGLDVYERTQLALIQLQTLFLAGELKKQELLNATRMAASVDRENLVVVEEIIKSKLG